jgi:CII-binding regulator of phage lambda lysogenization HflD
VSNHDFHPTSLAAPAAGLALAGAATLVAGVHNAMRQLGDQAQTAWTAERYVLGIQFLERRIRKQVDLIESDRKTIARQQLQISEFEGEVALLTLRLDGHA